MNVYKIIGLIVCFLLFVFLVLKRKGEEVINVRGFRDLGIKGFVLYDSLSGELVDFNADNHEVEILDEVLFVSKNAKRNGMYTYLLDSGGRVEFVNYNSSRRSVFKYKKPVMEFLGLASMPEGASVSEAALDGDTCYLVVELPEQEAWNPDERILFEIDTLSLDYKASSIRYVGGYTFQKRVGDSGDAGGDYILLYKGGYNVIKKEVYEGVLQESEAGIGVPLVVVDGDNIFTSRVGGLKKFSGTRDAQNVLDGFDVEYEFRKTGNYVASFESSEGLLVVSEDIVKAQLHVMLCKETSKPSVLLKIRLTESERVNNVLKHDGSVFIFLWSLDDDEVKVYCVRPDLTVEFFGFENSNFQSSTVMEIR